MPIVYANIAVTATPKMIKFFTIIIAFFKEKAYYSLSALDRLLNQIYL
jgi:hypothetical protein